MNDSAEQIIADAINRIYRENGRKIDRISVSWVDMTQMDSALGIDLRQPC